MSIDHEEMAARASLATVLESVSEMIRIATSRLASVKAVAAEAGGSGLRRRLGASGSRLIARRSAGSSVRLAPSGNQIEISGGGQAHQQPLEERRDRAGVAALRVAE